MALSIRRRLTLWNILALAVVLLGFSALVYGLLVRALYQRLDRSLLSEWEELERDPRLAGDYQDRLAYWIAEFYEHEKVFCVVYDAEGKEFKRTDVLAADSVPPVPAVGPGERRFYNATLPIVGRQRVLAGRPGLGNGDVAVVFMASLEETDRELAQLLAVLAMAGPIALGLAGFLGYWLARKALAPTEQLHRLTEEITADRLYRRLPISNPGDELGRLAQTINAMIGRLERSFAEIRRFTADASHELRTPLTAIRAEAEVALNKPLSTAEYQQLLGSILEECERLTHMTDQLLALSREDSGVARLVCEPVDLTALVQAVVDNMRPLAEAKGLQLRSQSDGPLSRQVDGTRLRQVFYNLLDNAIKYTPAGGTITVEIGQRDQDVIITVRDSGMGIASEHLPHVFDRFYRVDKARGRAEGGTGLGLSIARSIVTTHGGTIELDSMPGQGTTCTVTLPAQPQA
jgi:heavy metal sensor kinase